MPLYTPFTDLFSVDHPIASAPMGGTAGGALTAAVSSAGGLGVLGGGRSDLGWLDRECTIATRGTDRPWAVGFQTWGLSDQALELALSFNPAAVMLSFGDPGPFASRVRDAGVLLVVQVVDLDEARRAVDVGADVIVAQGDEAGGHGGGGRATLPFVPLVVDLAGPVPVLAAGGIADGRGLAAALALGAAGALIGSRFQATQESLADPEVIKAILDGTGARTERTRVLDIARDSPWPARYHARVLTNEFLDEWRGRETEFANSPDVRAAYSDAERRGDLNAASVWCGQSIDQVHDVPPAADVVLRLVRDAECSISDMAGLLA